MTRIARVKYKGMQFVIEEIFKRRVRALTIAENTETKNRGIFRMEFSGWKPGRALRSRNT